MLVALCKPVAMARRLQKATPLHTALVVPNNATVMYGLDRTMPGQAMCLGGANNGGGREGMRGQQVRSDPR